ncbi:hypothetical protein AMK21_14905 [Streptomyces sp. CB00316]|uniref:hypothetical protein n=1 Tax=unclassified Streptomyces TaxID=2593676 RepID=UPI00093F6C2C|nr:MULTISPECIES: hypothetical protein [unclassified Streptomyces]MBT2377875.1 hypothetical protein [Streptomyces sp. ISL-111]MBT2428791.1 hypothetical protein [Streptomyces sp. ISL-112]MBT2461207.1 hypothetical protein [Streptomyces sp. ISL-63]OKJ19646.1 hypothetical protein AMK21_14905 [Streptomyces sp. CB00316]
MSDLPRELREAARSHEPDRARMLARIERARPDTRGAPARRTRFAWPRVALVGFAAAGACVVGGFAVASVVQGPDDAPGSSVVQEEPPEERATPAPRPSAPAPSPPAPTGSPDTTAPTPSKAPEPPAGPPTPTVGGTPSRTDEDRPPAPGGGGLSTTDGPLWADGSVAPEDNPDWAQSEVTLKSQEPLTALTVELLVPQTGQVRSTGTWQTRPDGDFDLSVRERDGVLVHRWTLKAGRTIPAGTHVFAGQYDHAPGGRDAAPDTYRATARTADGTTYEVGGDFARTT